MKKMNRVLLLALLMLVPFAFAACGDDDDNPDRQTGDIAIARSYVGSYAARDSMNVNLALGYRSDTTVVYKITANLDGTINVTVPTEKYTGTQIGDLTIGTYTIRDIPYDHIAGAFVKGYRNDGLKVAFKSENGTLNINGTYDMNNAECVIRVSRNANNAIHIDNVYKMGASPMVIHHYFTSAQ